MRMRSRLAAAVIPLLPALWAVPGLAADAPEWAHRLVGQTAILAASVNQNPIVYHCQAGECATLLITGALHPLLAAEAVRFTACHARDEGQTIVLDAVSEHLGDGHLIFQSPVFSEQPIAEATMLALLDLIAPESTSLRFRAASGAEVYHFAGSNHCPETSGATGYPTAAAAEAAGLRPCPACFTPIHLIPGFQEELALGRSVIGQVTSSFVQVTDDRKQGHFESLARSVLAAWPLRLRGYDYHVTLINSGQPIAIACPGGWLFIDQSLLLLCESPLELEAVLAHEIAHVEMRHGYRTLKRAQQHAKIAAVLGVAAGAVAAASGDDAGARFAAEATGLILAAAAAITLQGYALEFQREADALAVGYLTKVHGPEARLALAGVLEKLKYSEECLSAGDFRDRDRPGELPIGTRIDFVRNAIVDIYTPPLRYTFTKGEELALAIEVLGVAQNQYRSRESRKIRSVEHWSIAERNELLVFTAAEATNALGDPRELRGLRVCIDGEWLRLDDREDTVIHPAESISSTLFFKLDKDRRFRSLRPTDIQLE